MIVEITSLAPTVALSRPAIPAHSAPARRLERPRDPAPRPPGGRGEAPPPPVVKRRGRPARRRPAPPRRIRADEVLALTADVEQPAAERERDRQAREDERRRHDQRL